MKLTRRAFVRSGAIFIPSLATIVRGQLPAVPLQRFSGSSLAALVTAWQARVISNGGASPSGATLTAVNTWYNALASAGIDTLMKEVNFFAPDSVIAAKTPFILTREAALWTAATSTVSVDGLSTDASTVVNTAGSGPNYFTDGSCGMTWYGQAPGAKPDQIQCGTGVGGNAQCIFLYPTVGVSYVYPGSPFCFVAVPASPFSNNDFGMLSLNRVATNDLRVFWGNNAITPVQAGSTVTNSCGSAPTTTPSWNVGTSAGTGGRFLYNFGSAYIHSLFAVHLGMTLTQVKALQSATATLRLAFGGHA